MSASTTTSNHPWWACFLCFPDIVEVGMIAPGYALTRYEGKYRILGGQGHSGDHIFTFKRKPTWDPYYAVWYLSDEEQDEFFESKLELESSSDSWVENHLNPIWVGLQLPLQNANYFYEACVEIGYDDSHSDIINWLINKCALLIDMYNLGIRDTDTEVYDLSDT